MLLSACMCEFCCQCTDYFWCRHVCASAGVSAGVSAGFSVGFSAGVGIRVSVGVGMCECWCGRYVHNPYFQSTHSRDSPQWAICGDTWVLDKLVQSRPCPRLSPRLLYVLSSPTSPLISTSHLSLPSSLPSPLPSTSSTPSPFP